MSVFSDPTPPPPSLHIIVLGAGVIGLTTALHLSRRFPSSSITLIAKTFPHIDPSNGRIAIDPSDPSYCSTKSGAHWYSFAADNDIRQKYLDRVTFTILNGIAEERPYGLTGVYRLTSHAIFTAPSGGHPDPWFTAFVPSFHRHSPTHFSFETVMVNVQLYLPYLLRQCQLHGVSLIQREVSNLDEDLRRYDPYDFVVNCTGLGSQTLAKDPSLIPTRGRTVIVHNEDIRSIWRMKKEGKDDEPVYVLPRGDGTVVLGGTYEDNNDNMKVGDPDDVKDAAIAQRILRDCGAIVPSLLDPKKTKIIGHSVGLRPTRKVKGKDGTSGTRIERDEGNSRLIHCYGHSGWGVQSSWGSAILVVDIINRALGRSHLEFVPEIDVAIKSKL